MGMKLTGLASIVPIALSVSACLGLATGCFWANQKSDSMTGFGAHALLGSNGHVEGAQVHGEVGFAGLYAGTELDLRDAVRPADNDTYHGIGLGFVLRGSLFGVLATDHELERWLDLGGEAGAGGGGVVGVPGHAVLGMESAWYGAWLEVGTVSLTGGYLAVTGGIRREVFGDPWLDQTQLAIGLAWRQREPMGELHFHD